MPQQGIGDLPTEHWVSGGLDQADLLTKPLHLLHFVRLRALALGINPPKAITESVSVPTRNKPRPPPPTKPSTVLRREQVVWLGAQPVTIGFMRSSPYQHNQNPAESTMKRTSSSTQHRHDKTERCGYEDERAVRLLQTVPLEHKANDPFGKAKLVTIDFTNMRPSLHFLDTAPDPILASTASTSGYSARGGMQRAIAG